jgi:CheY-like chemotaxis protein
MAKILVVDDDPDVVEAVSTVLQGHGHEVTGVHSREEGLAAIQAAQPDLLVLDCMMDQPDDGVVMARELRKDGFTRPILMFSNVNMVTGMNLEKDDDVMPVDEFQEKPVNPGDFMDKVNALLSK